MRVAFVSVMAGSAWGGSEELWADAAIRAAGDGHQVFASVYDLGAAPDAWPPKLRAVAAAGVRVVMRRRPVHWRIDTPLTPLRPRFRPLEAFAPDIVCISQGASYDVINFADCLELRRLLSHSSTPYFIVCQLNGESAPLTPARRREAKVFFEAASGVAFVAARNLDQGRRHLCSDLPRGLVLRNPVNLAAREPLPWPTGDGPARLACVARLEVAYKAHDVLLEALADTAWRGRDWTLELFGSGPDEVYIRDLIEHYDLGDRVFLRGHVADIRALWADRHALVLASHNEGTPLALVEAMVCGRPSIVTDVAGNAEWVQDGGGGFLAAAAAANAMRTALERAWTARAQWPEIGWRAAQTASGQLDPDPGASLLSHLVCAARSQ